MQISRTLTIRRSLRDRRGLVQAALGAGLAACALATTAGAAQPGAMWLSPQHLAALPTAGPAWEQLLAAAQADPGEPDINRATNTHNVHVLASALVAARLGLTGAGASYRAQAASGLLAVIDSEPGVVARDPAVNLQAYPIAADLIDLAELDAAGELSLRRWFTDVRYVCFGDHSFWTASEERPNNWGLANTAARLALTIYLDEHGGAPAGTCATPGACNPPGAVAGCATAAAEVERVATLFEGWLGAREVYAGFEFQQLSWQADRTQPVGINPAGATIEGADVDGVLPDDQRRSGKFRIPFRKENYVWEALQSVAVIAVLLDRRGYDVWRWQDHAVKRALDWLHRPHFARSGTEPNPAAGDDAWQPFLFNHFYGAAFPAESPARHGKNMGWTDWTHGPGSAAGLACPTPCDDGDVCNGYEFCDGETCRPGRPAVCDDANPCTAHVCDPSNGCTSEPIEAACDDGDACSLDTCDSLAGCLHTPVSGNCDDGNPCTLGDTCDAGRCAGVATPGCTTTTLPPPPLCGDANGDGQINSSDVITVILAASGVLPCDPSVCDVDASMTVTATDALVILHFVVGLTDALVCANGQTVQP